VKVIGYVRVSTPGQVEDGAGLDIQEQAIRSWSRQQRHRLLAILRDEGISGSNGIEHRVGLPDALHMIETGQAQGLVVHKLDRLARNLMVQETTLAQIWSMGGKVFSVDTGEVTRDDPDDPMRTAFRQMIGVFSQLDRAMIAARLRAGRRQKAAQGGYVGGPTRYGWRVTDGELVPDPIEQKVIETALSFRDQGLSLRGIATALDGLGQHPRSGRWHPETVKRLLEAAQSR
jgi:DNA invertase Pin-like site-specific DNA recombinase